MQAAVDESVPAPVISAALFARFASRGEADYADRLLSALRFEFGGHVEKPKEALMAVHPPSCVRNHFDLSFGEPQ